MGAPHIAKIRGYERLPLHLPLQFAREGRSDLIEGVTESISGDEVWFVSPELLQPGEQVDVELVLPIHGPGRNAFRIHLKCLVDVERVDVARLPSGFRVVCRIRDYKIQFVNTDLRQDQVS
jgi:hypothetical protein